MTGRPRKLPAAAVVLLVCGLLAGCGSTSGLKIPSATNASSSAGTGAPSANGPGSSRASAHTGTSASGMSNMAGMNTGSGVSTQAPKVGGIAPVTSQVLASRDWQGMQIRARTATPVPFYIFDGTREQLVKPPAHASFHLMIMLEDQHTRVPIPYAGVWATITNAAGKVVYDARQWPMLSEYMGPHYGNDVVLPGSGSYRLKLLISPPVSARHVEYGHVWLHPFTVVHRFIWKATNG